MQYQLYDVHIIFDLSASSIAETFGGIDELGAFGVPFLFLSLLAFPRILCRANKVVSGGGEGQSFNIFFILAMLKPSSITL